MTDDVIIEQRAVRREPVEVRENGDVRTLAGYAIVFDRLSEDLGGFRERILPQAVTKTIKERDVLAYAYHDPTQMLGRTSAGTMRLSVDERGVLYEVDVPDTTVGRDLATLVARGDITGSSFGFRVVRDSWDEGENTDVVIRTVEELELHHVAPTPDPAYLDTTAALRSLATSTARDIADVRAAAQAHTLPDLLAPGEPDTTSEEDDGRETTAVFCSPLAVF